MSELALKRIAKEKKERTGKLDLSECGLKIAPEQIFDFVRLQTLDLSFNQISDISFLTKLTSLETLELNGNRIRDYSPLEKLTRLESIDLRGNKIDNISFLQKLRSLRVLYLSGNQINNIRCLEEITSLEVLNLRGNQVKDVRFLEKLTSLKKLDLRGNEVIETKFLEELTKLESLDLRANQIRDIGFLQKLTALEELNLSDNQISNIGFLLDLRNLQRFDLSGNKISNTRFLENLTSLKKLDLHGNQITDISFLSKLTTLQSLDLSNNQISDIKFLEKLTCLEALNLRGNQISDIGFVEKLVSLLSLDLRSNQVTDISALTENLRVGRKIDMGEYSEYCGEGLLLYNNPIAKPPLEILKQGNEAILAYFESLEKAEKEGNQLYRLNEIKLLLVGEGAAGKTSLLKQLKGLKFKNDESKTHGINIEGIKLDELPVFEEYQNLKDVTLNVWDFGGQEIMHASHQIFLTNRSIYIYVLDSRTDARKDYWLHHIERFGDDSPALVAINKVDKNPVFDLERSSLNKKYPFIENRFHRISCREGTGLEDFKRQLAELIPKTKLFQTHVAESWIRVKEALEKATDDDRYIGEPKFIAICEANGIDKERERKTLLRFLHDLGIVFHFENLRLQGFYVLDPLWVTVGIYRIINSYAIKDGILEEGQLAFILNEEDQKKEEYSANREDWVYNSKEQVNLLDIMEEFELLYRIEKQKYLVPDLLPKEPEELMEAPDEALHFILIYDFLTQSLYNRLIVQMREDIRDYERISGVQSFFENKVCEAKALVNLDLDKKRIDIQIWGEEKRQYLTIIRDKLEKIHSSFSSLQVERNLPVPGYKDLLVDFDELVGLERMGEREYLLGKIGRRFSISEDFLDKVTSIQERMEQDEKSIKRHELYGSGDIVIDNRQTIQAYGGNAEATNKNKIKTEQKVEVSVQIQNIQTLKDEASLITEAMEKQKERLLKKLSPEEVEDAEEDLATIQESLTNIEEAEKNNEKPDNKIARRFGQVFKDFEDEESPIRKTLKSLRRGKDYAVNLARTYNKVAENLGMPSVPPLALDVIEKL